MLDYMFGWFLIFVLVFFIFCFIDIISMVVDYSRKKKNKCYKCSLYDEEKSKCSLAFPCDDVEQ